MDFLLKVSPAPLLQRSVIAELLSTSHRWQTTEQLREDAQWSPSRRSDAATDTGDEVTVPLGARGLLRWGIVKDLPLSIINSINTSSIGHSWMLL